MKAGSEEMKTSGEGLVFLTLLSMVFIPDELGVHSLPKNLELSSPCGATAETVG